MIIDSVLVSEKERNLQMINEYEKRLLELPKGVLVCKKTGYYYLKYRVQGKVHDDYIGKDEEKIKEISEKIALRKHYEEMLIELKAERKKILKLIGENI